MNPRIDLIKRLCFWVVLGAVILPSIMFFAGNYSRFFIDYEAISQSDEFKLSYTGEPFIDQISLVQRELQEGECVLVLRQAEFGYYQDGCIVNYLDPRLIDFYNSDSLEVAAGHLATLNIRFVVVPNGYGMSEVYNSELEGLLANDNFSRLVQQSSVFDLYELSTQKNPITPQNNLAGERDFGAFKSQDLLGAGVVVYSGKGDYTIPDRAYLKSPMSNSQSVYNLKLKFEGKGFYRIFISDYTPPTGLHKVAYDNQMLMGWALSEKLIWEGIVDGERIVNRRLIRALNEKSGFRIAIYPIGRAIEPESITAITEYSDYEPPYYSRQTAQKAGYTNGWNSYSDAARRNAAWIWGSNNRDSAYLSVEKKNNYFLSKMFPIDDITKSIKVSYDFESDRKHHIATQSVNNRYPIKPVELALREWLAEFFDRVPKDMSDELTESVNDVFGDIVTGHIFPLGADRYRILETDILSEMPATTGSVEGNQVCINVVEDSDFVQLIIMLLGDKSQTIDSISRLSLSISDVESFANQDCSNNTNTSVVY